MGHRNRGNHWTLWRRSGDDRRIKRTETWEGVLCERWDSRRGSVRRSSPYRAGRQESTRWRQESAVTTGYHGAIIILSCHAPQQMGAALTGIAPSQDHTGADQCVPRSRLRRTISARENFKGPDVWANGRRLFRMLKKTVQQGRSERRPEAYPLGRTVRRIRSTTFVRAAEW